MNNDKIVEWFGADRLKSNHDKVRAFWNGQQQYIVSINSSESCYRQIFDIDGIVIKAQENLRHQATVAGINIPAMFVDFGTISVPKYWGGKSHFDSSGANIFIEPVTRNLDEAINIDPCAVDDPNMDAFKALVAYKRLCATLHTDNLWLRTPDMQGVLNTAAMIMDQEELLIGMYSDPQKVHKFLNKVCDFLIKYFNYFKKNTLKICGNVWPYTFLPCELGICLTEDMMPLLSPEAYVEFGIPYLKRISDEFGQVQIHCCGKWGQHAENLRKSGIRISAVEYHHPFTKYEELDCLSKDVAFIPYYNSDAAEASDTTKNNLVEYYECLLEKASPDRRFWFAFFEESEAACRFAAIYT